MILKRPNRMDSRDICEARERCARRSGRGRKAQRRAGQISVKHHAYTSSARLRKHSDKNSSSRELGNFFRMTALSPPPEMTMQRYCLAVPCLASPRSRS